MPSYDYAQSPIGLKEGAEIPKQASLLGHATNSSVKLSKRQYPAMGPIFAPP